MKVITGLVRFSYVHVFVPYARNEGDKKKYSVAILVPKTDKKTIAELNAAIEEAYQEGVIKYKLVPSCKKPLRDGDIDRPDDENYAGMMFFNANTDRKPGVVDANGQAIMVEDEVYSGCWGRISVNMYPFTTGNKGVAAGLGNLQKLEEGEPLSGGGASAASDFGLEVDDMM